MGESAKRTKWPEALIILQSIVYGIGDPVFAFFIYRVRYKWQHIVLQVMVIPGLYLLCVRGGLSGFGIGEIVTLASAMFGAGALIIISCVTASTLTAATHGSSPRSDQSKF